MKEPFNPETHFESSHGLQDANGSGVEILIRMPLVIAEDRKIRAYVAMQDAVHQIADIIRL